MKSFASAADDTLVSLAIFRLDHTGEGAWVGSIALVAEYVKTMEDITEATFIVLSSTATQFSVFLAPYGKSMIFDETIFGPLSRNTPGAPPVLYNVMWIDWMPKGVSTRLGVGQIHKDGWEMSDSLERSIELG